MAEELEEVTQRFAADVEDYLADIEEGVAVAREYAAANQEAKAAVDGMRDAAASAAPALGSVRDRASEAGEALGELFRHSDEVIAAQHGVRDSAAEEALALGHVRDEALAASAATRDLGGAQKNVGSSGKAAGESYSQGFSGVFSNPYVIVGAVVAALAVLPAVAASAGAVTGIALGAALLIGTSQVKGPLYGQFHDLMHGLLGELRQATLPLAQPLALAFAQIGQWAQRLKPELTAVFSSLGPLVMPFTRALEGLISGVLPGFLNLMRAAQPAMQAVSVILSQLGTRLGALFTQLVPGVVGSSQVLSGLMGIVTSLLPVIGTFASDLSQALAPIMSELGQTVVPQLAAAIDQVLTKASPLMPEIGQLVVLFVQASINAMPLIDELIQLASDVLPHLVGPLQTVISWVTTLSNVAQTAFGWVERLVHAAPQAAQLIPNSAGGWQRITAPSVPAPSPDWLAGLTSIPSASSGATIAQTTEANNIGRQITAALGAGVRETIPQAQAAAARLMTEIRKELAAGAITASEAASLVNSVDKALAAHVKATEAAAAKIGATLTDGLVMQITSESSVSALKTAIGKLFADIKTAYDAGVITLSQDRYDSTILTVQAQQLETLAAQRAKVVAEIAQAKQYAASTASSVAGNYTISSFATSGLNGGAATAGQVVSSLRAGVGQIRKWAGNIKKLAKEGLDRTYLGQLIGLGPIQGAALVQELADAGLGDIKAINSAQYEIAKESGSVGKFAADALYDSGVNAGKGFLSGLESQKKAITQLMESIAKAMIATLKRELGISSPARVPRWHALMVGEGIVQGLMDSIDRIKHAAALVAAAALPGAGRALGSATAGGYGAYGGHAAVNVTVPIHMDATASAFASPAFMQGLQRVLQEAVLRYAQMNPNNGLTPMWGRG